MRVRDVRRLLPSLALAACSGASDDRVADIAITDSAGVTIVHSRLGADSPVCRPGGETLRIGDVDEASGRTLFGVNDAAVLDDGRVAVVNRGTSQIKIFAPDGRLVDEFGRQGGGPGEFRNLWSVDVRGDTLVVGDYRPWRFTFFTPEGALLRRVELKPPVVERPDFAIPLAAGAGFVVEEPSFDARDAMVDRVVPLRTYGEDGALNGTAGDFWLDRYGYLAKEIGYVGSPIFGAKATFSHLRDDRIVYGAGRHEQLEIRSARGELLQIVRWQSRDRSVAAGDADEWRRQKRREFEARFEITPRMRPVIDAQIGAHLPVADAYPGHDRIVVARDGDIWVQEYRRPIDEGPARWWVFREDGRFVCAVSLPPDLRVLAVGGGRVLGLVLDSLDVEYVVGYDITDPAER